MGNQDLNTKWLLEAAGVPLLLAAEEGEPEGNSFWDAVEKEAEGITEEALRIAENALRAGKPEASEFGRFLLTASPSGGPGGYVLVRADPEEMRRLRETLENTVKSNASYQAKLSHFGTKNYIATSGSMIRIFTKAKQVAAYPTTILILGETGVGKEVLATFIHNHSGRSGKPFIKINCSAIPEPLMESEMFGYESGAFTGARQGGRMGLFELANTGTILLDEIGDMSLALQSKLLRVLQEGEVLRVGGRKPVPLDFRLIAATSRDLSEMMREGTFLEALYYRLNVVELDIPPLRERREDILPLAEFYLQHFSEKYKLHRELSHEVKDCLNRYAWPGNVRELRNTVENLAISSDGEVIRAEELPNRIRMGGMPERLRSAESVGAKEEHIPAGGMKDAVEELQRGMIRDAFKNGGSIRKAAAILGMDQTTLRRLVKKLELHVDEK